MDLERLTVVVGPNSSGKSSLLHAIHLALASAVAPPQDLFLNYNNPLLLISRGRPWPMELAASGTWANAPLSVRMRMDGVESSRDKQSMWKGEVRIDYGGASTLHVDPEKSPSDSHPGLSDTIEPISRLRLLPAAVARPTLHPGPRPWLSQDGENCTSILAYMAGSTRDGLRELEEALKRIIPMLQAIRVVPALVDVRESIPVTIEGKTTYQEVSRPKWGNGIEFDFVDAAGIPASEASAGTLLALGLLAALLAPRRPRLLLMDDVDQGLHPLAQGELIQILRRVLADDPDLQIVATSHSPYLLDHLEPEEVRLTLPLSGGEVCCAKLTDHPEFEEWKRLMLKPGEVYSNVGSEWIRALSTRHD